MSGDTFVCSPHQRDAIVIQSDSQSASVRAQPLFFGSAGRRLFGWYHPAHGPISRNSAIVACPPLGHEYAWTHRAFRCLAAQLAAEGFSVMRFDYQGTGNSAGDPDDPAQLRGWLDSIRDAIAKTRELSGTDSVTLIGLRLGATLAMIHAAEHEDVSSMVLWAPFLSGDTYLRELHILRTMTSRPPSREPVPTDAVDYGAEGFFLTPDTAAELREINLLSIGRTPPRVLVIPRDDRPHAHRPLVDHLSQSGADARQLHVPGTAALLVESVRSIVPGEVLSGITHWLGALYPPTIPSDPISPRVYEPRSYTPSASSTAVTPGDSEQGEWGGCTGVDEVPIRFGQHANLFGIATVPRPDQHSRGRPAVIFLNTGADHHIGPNRMYVPMARALADLGFLSFRFDLAGLGESLPSRGEDHITYPNGAVQDIAEAIALLRSTYGVESVIVVGLCSGAYFAIRAALSELPVAMCMSINPPLYSENGRLVEAAELRNYSDVVLLREALWARKRWLKPFGGPLGLSNVLAASQIKTSVTMQKVRSGLGLTNSSEGNGVGALLESLCNRGVDICIVFAHGERARTDLELQLGWQLHALRGQKNFRFEIIDGAGHGFRPKHAQQQLRTMLVEHIIDRFGDSVNA
ncbi:MAG: alpha/beta fold hydrolase [Gemmatimonadaceae bacterium]